MNSRSSRHRTGWFPLVALLLAPVIFIALSVVRAWRVAEGAGNYTSCHDCFWLPTFGHDAWLFAVMLIALALGLVVRWRVPAFVCRLVAALILAIFAADIALDSLLSSRLHFGDVLRFGRHIDADFSVASAAFASSQSLGRTAFGLLVIAVVVGLCAATRRRPKLAAAFAIGAAASLAFCAFALSRPVRYVNQIFTWNFVEANLPQGRMKSFSASFIAEQRRRVEALPKTCAKSPEPFGGSVIVLLVESLSSWHSRLLGSSRDWTPELDAIARENHYFTHFYANGFTTSTAEIAVIAAQPPLAPAGKLLFGFSDYAATDGTLPDIAHRSGREAAFFTTGDVSFLDFGDWLRQLEFDVVGSSADPFYRGMKRWQFGAAEDRALYDRVLRWLDPRDGERPFVATLLTVSTHPPYVDPRSGRIDPENAFRYVDAEIGRFYRELKERGFLDHGVLLSLGDHRTMTPLHEEEYRQHGERAFARVPLVVAGAVDLPKVVDAPFQQTDIGPSIADLVGLDACNSAFTGHFLRTDPKPAGYVLHVRGDDRDRLDVYWDDEVSAFHYDGDASGWLTKPPPDAADVAAWIDVHRDRDAEAPPRASEP